MARSYVYRLYHGQVAAAAGVAELVIPGDCRCVGIHCMQSGQGGAGLGFYMAELAVNNNAVTNAGVNYPPRNLTLASWQITYPNAGAAQQDTGFMPCDVPLRSGDRLSINQTASGTNAATVRASVDVYVLE